MEGGILGLLTEGGAAAGGRFVALAILVHTARKLFEYVCNFLAGRHDARQARIDALDIRLNASLAARLHHLEETELQNRDEIRRLREAVEVLAGALRLKDPTNPKLLEVARLLSPVIPFEASLPSDMKETLGKMP